MSLKSEIKVGSRFEFSVHGEEETRRKAIVTRFFPIEKKDLGRT